MTFDVVAFRAPEGFDPEEVAQAVLNGSAARAAMLLPAIDRDAVVRLLKLRFPQLGRLLGEAAPVAASEALSGEESQEQARVTLAWKERGVEIAVTGHTVAVRVLPSAGRGDAAATQAMARILRVLTRDARLHLYDPSAEQLVEAVEEELAH